MMNFKLDDKKNRFRLEYSLDNTDGLVSVYLENVIVFDEFRDKGFAKRIIYTLWRISEIHKINYFIVKVISPIIQTIITNYYKYEVITKFTYKILGIIDSDYSESLLAIFLPIYRSIEQARLRENSQ
jgi:hypothetical protein